jgi:inosose dehydratase
MSQIQFGCQFYTWQMSGQRYVGQLPHILSVVGTTGFAGIEPETCMLGAYYEDPWVLKDLLDAHDLRLGAIALVCDWAAPVETDEERAEAERLFDYLAAFPGTHLMLCQLPGRDRASLRQRQRNAIACVNAVATRAAERGIASSFHPNSPPGSVFRVWEDYQIMLDSLDEGVVGYAPDSGHIAKGGMDVMEVFRIYRSAIVHVHFKDITAAGEWAAMGAGVIDFPHLVTLLRDSGYSGWIMVEEESAAAEADPDGATVQNGAYLQQSLWPLVR